MILHHYIWGDIDIDIVEEVAPHFLIAKHYGNLALFCRLTKHQSHYFRNSDKRFYAAGFDDEGKSMNPSDEYIPFVPDILYDDDGIGYLCLMQPSWLHTIDDIRHKIDGILATDKKIREHDEYYVGSCWQKFLRNTASGGTSTRQCMVTHGAASGNVCSLEMMARR